MNDYILQLSQAVLNHECQSSRTASPITVQLLQVHFRTCARARTHTHTHTRTHTMHARTHARTHAACIHSRYCSVHGSFVHFTISASEVLTFKHPNREIISIFRQLRIFILQLLTCLSRSNSVACPKMSLGSTAPCFL